MKLKKTGIYIPSGRKVWAHEMRVAEILASAGHCIEFLPELNSLPTADIRLDGIEYEIKSPERFNPNTLEHAIRDAMKQSPNLIVDTSRMRRVSDHKVQNFLIQQLRKEHRIRHLFMITKQGQIIDILNPA